VKPLLLGVPPPPMDSRGADAGAPPRLRIAIEGKERKAETTGRYNRKGTQACTAAFGVDEGVAANKTQDSRLLIGVLGHIAMVGQDGNISFCMSR
jgi:hypothetical protein